MIRSFFTTAIRNILRNKKISLINIIGLALSMSIGMLIIVLIQDQISYDDFINRNKEIYRIQSIDKMSKVALNKFGSTTFPLAEELKSNYPFIEKITALNSSFRGEVVEDDIRIRISGFYAEDNFLDMFNFNLIRGSVSEALKDPFSIVMKEDLAKKIFGDEDPMGKTINIENFGNLKVTGIIASEYLKTHIDFESLVSSSTIRSRSLQDPDLTDHTTNWLNFFNSYIYLIPEEGTDLSIIKSALDDISAEKYGDKPKVDVEFYLFPFNKIVPGPILSNTLGESMPRVFLFFFAGLATLIIISAAFNYTSLSIARSMTRAKEFGIRKTVGATRRELTGQIFIEAIVLSLLSLVFAIGILQIILPAFKGFKLMSLLGVNPQQNVAMYLWFILFALLTGILAGGLPALYISRINPVTVLKGSGNLKIFKRLTFRKFLLVSQYFISIVFIISIILIYRQMNYMVNAEMGFDREIVYNISLRGKDGDLIKDRFSRVPEVSELALCSHFPGIGNFRETEVKLSEDQESILSHYFAVDNDYIETMGLNLVAGENFSKEMSSNGLETFIILTELAVENYNLGTPTEAIGANIIVDDTLNMEVIGVVEDYKYCALFLPFRPLLLRTLPEEYRYAALRLQTSDMGNTIEKFKEVWHDLDPVHEMQGELLDTEIRDYYLYFEDILFMVAYSALLAIVIACLGLLGMASYSTQTRTKEVGVRKVFGADSRNIIRMISKSSIILIGIASLIGGPVAYLINVAWLNYVPHHVSFGAGTILIGILVVSIFGIGTITSQTLKVSATNPAQTLKYE